MYKELKQKFAALLSAAELAKVTGGKDPVPDNPPPPPPNPGDLDDLAG